MSLITLPIEFQPRTVVFKLDVNQRVAGSQFGGSEQVRDLLNDRWLVEITLADSPHDAAAWRDAFIASFRGSVNWVALHHFARCEPRGTMRGSPTLSGSHAQGASVLSITGGTANSTLLAGDMLGVGGLLVMVAEDVTLNGSGAGSVAIVNRLRAAQTNATAIVWNRPTALFRLVDYTPVLYEPGFANAPSFQFVERVA